jgi:hypothetical protein
MGNALGEHYETLHAAKHRMSAQRKKLQVRRFVSITRLCRRIDGVTQEAISQVREPYLKIQARKEEALGRAMKMVIELGEFPLPPPSGRSSGVSDHFTVE